MRDRKGVFERSREENQERNRDRNLVRNHRIGSRRVRAVDWWDSQGSKVSGGNEEFHRRAMEGEGRFGKSDIQQLEKRSVHSFFIEEAEKPKERNDEEGPVMHQNKKELYGGDQKSSYRDGLKVDSVKVDINEEEVEWLRLSAMGKLRTKTNCKAIQSALFREEVSAGANEVIDILEKGQKGGFLFKVDFEKAYDSVDWGFLQFIMGKIGFARKWRKWIMGCLTTDNISVLVNGVPTEGWKEAYDRAFIDNTMIFYKPQHQNLINAKRVLRCFQLVCSLKNNFHKSSLIGIGVDDQLVRRRAGRIACRIGELPSVGRVTLLQLVLVSLPIFFMSLFPILREVKNELEKIKRRFLWSGVQEKRKIHDIGWDKVCRYEDGGLGIIDLEIKNRTLLNKWIWRYGRERDSLWREVIVEKTRGGNERRIRFWTDRWTKGILKESFPKIFALATDKGGLVNETLSTPWYGKARQRGSSLLNLSAKMQYGSTAPTRECGKKFEPALLRLELRSSLGS
ncbi:Uncharacterized protein TCM_044508 [Theobroma cacao]|uniref:Reverse transcriptase domain-containing protein n=1 Tax=Theobroma cacao TaxID=3641 RepID=A0A061FRY0_THECC|nr:Uncharacterized protein TCM_044508 [Theobroma cacao]